MWARWTDDRCRAGVWPSEERITASRGNYIGSSRGRTWRKGRHVGGVFDGRKCCLRVLCLLE